jgi:hypothetical protein
MLSTLILCAGTMAAASPPAEDRSWLLARDGRVRSGERAVYRVSLPPIAPGQQARLSVRMRVDWPGLAGFNPWTVIGVNGAALTCKDLINKPSEFTCRNGVEGTWARGPQWVLLYSQDFSDQAVTLPIPWGFPNQDPYAFQWDVTPYLRPGENTISVEHLKLLAQETVQVIKDLDLRVGRPVPSRNTTDTVSPAPRGPLPLCVASGRKRVAMEAALSPGGSLRVRVAGRTFALETFTSEPGGKWTQSRADGGPWHRLQRPSVTTARAVWRGRHYRVEREVSLCDDHLAISDRLTNTSDALVGVIYRNRLDLSGQPRPKQVLLCGKTPCSATGQDEPSHPSAMALWDDLAMGIFAEDDIYRVHVRCTAVGASGATGSASAPGATGSASAFDGLEIADPRLGIGPGQSHVLQWSIYPAPGGDYWDLVNAVRRNWGSNITIPGPGSFDFLMHRGKSQEEFDRFVAARKLAFAVSDQTVYGDGGWAVEKVAEGTDIPNATPWCHAARTWVERMHRASPNIRCLVYMHPTICTKKNGQTLYADSRLLDCSGAPVMPPAPVPLYQYIPTLGDSYGKAYLETFHWIISEIRADGIYMDEFANGSYPQYVYHTAWDGCSLDINQETHEVAGRCASSVLLMQPWKGAVVRYLKEHGKILLGNSPAFTRTMLQWQMPLFTETMSLSFLRDMHFCTPLGLGNNAADPSLASCAKMVRKALDHAGTIMMYDWSTAPEGFHFQHVMFPLTPEELRAGMVLGRERILTNRSGRYGWPDGADAEVYVFDGAGKRVPSPSLDRRQPGGRTTLELRMPGDHFAVLVKRQTAAQSRSAE